ncbi:hypothetical protein WJ0W_006907 [Paenibacillus melissococcoides]|uniref:DUF2188 domain-containing protein n=1 Tax=Paenibacillus melissococcoides TaxID=2912268 RepID=A0ABM9GC22_9BACL|nr:hypothetical protein [Paenibacillus melissococcoides]CAH8249723.1 hypothetical protein WJ0W_006907 [Paenibacillus melissococcoides]
MKWTKKNASYARKLAAKLDEARNLTNGGKLEEARAAADAAKELRKQIDLHEELRATDTGGKNYTYR